MEELARSAEAHLVHWPVNKEAPFHFAQQKVHMHVRDADVAALEIYLDRLGPDIIFVSGWVDKAYLRIARKHRKRGIPVVLCSDTGWRGTFRQVLAIIVARSWIQRTFTHAWVTGKAQLEYAHKLGFSADRTRSGFYSADTGRFLEFGKEFLEQRRTKWPHRFLCVARYIPTKGHQYLCDAFASLAEAGEAGDWELWIAGTGELHEQVKNSRSGRHPRIRHLGFKQPHEMKEVMAQCGVFVLPSSYEPWGVVVHEHACAGFPLLLSSAVGSAERFLRVQENGALFKAGDVNDLKEHLRQMIRTSDDQLRSMGLKSRQLGEAWGPVQWAETAMDLMKERS
jgi:glycosyltransferase involved in cell wall biosynthesis